MSERDGGPAFPTATFRNQPTVNQYGERGSKGMVVDVGGMSLHDWFAGKALQGLMANPNVVGHNCNVGWGLVNCTHDVIAGWCSAQADAMLKARDQ